MQVKIVRNTGIYGSAGRMNVKVDGEKVGALVMVSGLTFL